MTPSSYYAACTLGLESVLVDELGALGASSIVERRGGATFEGDREVGYRACLWLRSAIRVQHVLATFEADSAATLYERVVELPWEEFLGADATLAVDASVRDSTLRHSGFAALKVKDAIVDRMRARTGRRPDVDTRRPTLPLKLVLHNNRAQLSRDLSGASLHKRGYRPVQVKSPLNEATAAGLLLLAGWDRRSDFADPMCGSGTFVIEAARLAADIAPGLGRRFAFEGWPDHDRGLWSRLRDEARARVRTSVPCRLEGADRHAGAIGIARRSAERGGVADLVRWHVASAARWAPSRPPAFVITNPPYGERLGETSDELEASWRELATFLKQRCPGAVAHVLSGNAEVTRALRLKASRRWPVRNGPIDCRLLRYEIFDPARRPARDDARARPPGHAADRTAERAPPDEPS